MVVVVASVDGVDAGNVMFAVPSKLTPLIVRAVANLVAVAALPETEPALPADCQIDPL